MGQNLDQIVQLLPKLDSDELALLYRRLKAMASLSSQMADGVVAPQDDKGLVMLFIEAIAETIEDHKLGAVHPAALARSRANNEEFRSSVATVAKHLGLSDLSRNASRAMVRIGMDSLLNSLRTGIPVRWSNEQKRLIRAPMAVTARDMMIFIGQLPACLDAEYPGYLELGLLHTLVKGDVKKRNPSGEE